MNRPQFAPRACRPRDHLIQAGKLYPRAWKIADHFRAGRGQGELPNWPDWCYLPVAAGQAIVAEDAGIDVMQLGLVHPERIEDAARLTALAAWRMTQGIYRFDPAVYEAVRDTPVTGDIPHDVLYRLPEWCVYVETPGLAFGDLSMAGFFAHLEHDPKTGEPELRLLPDVDLAPGEQMILSIPLLLGAWSLAEAITRTVASAATQAMAYRIELPTQAMQQAIRQMIEPAVSLLLYLCSQANEVGNGQRRPTKPVPKRVKGAWRLFPAERVMTWDVGVRLGAALRAAYAAEQTGGAAAGGQAAPRGHVRRAHWHGFRSGPRLRPDGSEIPAAELKFDLRWLPPIPVNLPDVGDLPSVVRPVK